MPKVLPAAPSARSEYAAAKLAVEVSMQNRCLAGRLDASIVRPFNVTGPRQSASGGFVLPRFVSQALTRRPLTVYGSGLQVRSFAHVAETAEGIITAHRCAPTGGVFNIGNEANRITILALAEMVIEVTGSSSFISHCDPKKLHGAAFEDGADKYPVGNQLLGFGWSPRKSVREIIVDTAEFLAGCDSAAFTALSGFPPEAAGPRPSAPLSSTGLNKLVVFPQVCASNPGARS